jgi:hypothetical protein
MNRAVKRCTEPPNVHMNLQDDDTGSDVTGCAYEKFREV